jgi:hypothetical protein
VGTRVAAARLDGISHDARSALPERLRPRLRELGPAD